MAAIDPKFHRLRGIVALALLQIGASGVINSAQAVAIAVQQQSGAAGAAAPLAAAIPSVFIGGAMLRSQVSQRMLYLASLACVAGFLFAAILIVDQWSNGASDAISAHGQTKRFLYWFLAFSASVFAISHWKRANRHDEHPKPQTTDRRHLLAGLVGFALIECRAENVIGFLFIVPRLDELSQPWLLVASLGGGLIPMIVGSLLALGRVSLLPAALGAIIAALLLATNARAYAALFETSFPSAADALIIRLNATGLLYWLFVAAAAALLVRDLWLARSKNAGTPLAHPRATPSAASSE